MKIIAIIQARTGSSRLPQKVLRRIDGERTLLDCVIDNVQALGILTVVSTTDRSSDDPLAELCERRNISVARGPQENVLERYIHTLDRFPCDACLRVCGDNPFLDTQLAANLLRRHKQDDVDYTGYLTLSGRPAICLPAGLFAECVSSSALRRLHDSNPPIDIAEHVTLGVYSDSNYSCAWETAPAWATQDWLRLTCDTTGDLTRLRRIYAERETGTDLRDLLQRIQSQAWLKNEMLKENKQNLKPNIIISTARYA